MEEEISVLRLQWKRNVLEIDLTELPDGNFMHEDGTVYCKNALGEPNVEGMQDQDVWFHTRKTLGNRAFGIYKHEDGDEICKATTGMSPMFS